MSFQEIHNIDMLEDERALKWSAKRDNRTDQLVSDVQRHAVGCTGIDFVFVSYSPKTET